MMNRCSTLFVITSIVLLSLCHTKAWAQEQSVYDASLPVVEGNSVADMSRKAKIEKSTLFAIGHMNRYDTYLSPLEYRGTDVRFISSVLRKRHSKWDIQFTHEGAVDYTKNRADNASTVAGHYDFAFAMMHRWTLVDGDLTLRLGGMTDFMLGFAYNMRNSANNPAQGYAQLAIGGAGKASYSFTKWKRKFRVNYEARLPIVGIMFSPNYGQSYYEIFSCKNYDRNVVVYTIGTPSLHHMLTLDVPVTKRSYITVGYLGDIRQAKPNNLRQHTYTNSFVLGWSTGL